LFGRFSGLGLATPLFRLFADYRPWYNYRPHADYLGFHHSGCRQDHGR
jgi:hypothetical protein